MGWRGISSQSLFYLSPFSDMPLHNLSLFLIGNAYSQSLCNISAQEIPYVCTEEMKMLPQGLEHR